MNLIVSFWAFVDLCALGWCFVCQGFISQFSLRLVLVCWGYWFRVLGNLLVVVYLRLLLSLGGLVCLGEWVL